MTISPVSAVLSTSVFLKLNVAGGSSYLKAVRSDEGVNTFALAVPSKVVSVNVPKAPSSGSGSPSSNLNAASVELEKNALLKVFRSA